MGGYRMLWRVIGNEAPTGADLALATMEIMRTARFFSERLRWLISVYRPKIVMLSPRKPKEFGTGQ